MKDWFKFRTAWLQAIGMFELEAAGRLFLAVITYAATGEEPALSGPEMAVFTVIAQVLREDAELSARKSAAGAQGGRPKKIKVGDKKQCFQEKKQCFSEEYDSEKQCFSEENGGEKQCFLNEKQCFSEENGGKKQCFFTPPEAPEGPRIKALDSAPAEKTIQTEEEERNIDIYPTILPSSSETSIRPSAEEVAAYCQEQGYSVNAKEFVNYYNSNGWMIGNDPIRDWKAFVRIWERNEKWRDRSEPAGTGVARPAKTVAAQQYSQRDYSDEDEEAFARMLATAREQGF